jgi:hypothetical protein
VVESGTDQYRADVTGGAAPLSGYVSPVPPPNRTGPSVSTPS